MPVGDGIVQCQVRQEAPIDMLVFWSLGCHDYTVGIDAAVGGLGSEILKSILGVLEYPEDTIGNLLEHVHPDLECHRIALVKLVEVGKDELALRQPIVGALRPVLPWL